MALEQILQTTSKLETKKQGISEERIRAQLPIIRQYVAFWREYPDIFVEFLCGNNPENFHLYFYQRVFLRAVMRHRYAYATFPRAYSKSFLSVLILMLRCVLFPRRSLFRNNSGVKNRQLESRVKKQKNYATLFPV